MSRNLNRRHFLEMTAATTAAFRLAPGQAAAAVEGGESPIRVGIIGVGNRGTSLLRTLLSMNGVSIPALCDINLEHLARGQDIVMKAGLDRPHGYSDGEDRAFKALLDRDDLDAVLIATPWGWHTPMAVYGMKAGKYVGVEVPAALTLQQCWDLVNTHEQTGVPCMMLENWSFRRDNLAVLNMIRRGLLGDIVHCHCAHSHDCIDHWFFDPQGNDRWPAKFLLERNADQYPTHSLGPVLSWLDINCGDAFATVTSTATASTGINAYFARKFGSEHPHAKRRYAQGDIVTTVVKTKKEKTIVINYDMQLPRPYDNRWTVQGTKGIYNEQRDAVYLVDRSPEYHAWESFDRYQKEFDHPWWKEMQQRNPQAGHGGTDHLELQLFLEAVRRKTQTPIDVYDSVVMSVIVPLSEQSIAGGGVPLPCPDFTRGKWESRTPSFAMGG